MDTAWPLKPSSASPGGADGCGEKEGRGPIPADKDSLNKSKWLDISVHRGDKDIVCWGKEGTFLLKGRQVLYPSTRKAQGTWVQGETAWRCWPLRKLLSDSPPVPVWRVMHCRPVLRNL